MTAQERPVRRNIKFQMMLSQEDASRIDDWMFSNRVRSRAEAIRSLCKIAINQTSVNADTTTRGEK